jgi:hypothetical protein
LQQERAGLEWVEAEGELVLDVAPLPGRMLVLLSGLVDHAVAPAAHTDLTSLTAWF